MALKEKILHYHLYIFELDADAVIGISTFIKGQEYAYNELKAEAKAIAIAIAKRFNLCPTHAIAKKAIEKAENYLVGMLSVFAPMKR